MLNFARTVLDAEELESNWTVVAEYDELTAYRSNESGLLRIIDVDSGMDILEDIGNPITKSIEDAKAKADAKMGVVA